MGLGILVATEHRSVSEYLGVPGTNWPSGWSIPLANSVSQSGTKGLFITQKLLTYYFRYWVVPTIAIAFAVQLFIDIVIYFFIIPHT